MNLDELDAPGTEYAVQQRNYNAPARCRLIEVVKTVVDPDSMRPKTRRFARMTIVEGRVSTRSVGDAIRVSGRSILMEWAEYERRNTERERKRAEHEQAKAAAERRCLDIRARTSALGLDVGDVGVLETRLDQAFGRWHETHLMVDVELFEALLEHVEVAMPKRGKLQVRGGAWGMPEGYEMRAEVGAEVVTSGQGDMRGPQSRPAAQRVVVSRDGVEVAERLIPLDADAMPHAIEMAEDNAAHEHALAP